MIPKAVSFFMIGVSTVLRPGFETPGWAYSGGQL